MIALATAGLAAAAPASRTWDALSQLNSGAPIEVVTTDHTQKGEFVSVSTETLTIHTRNGEERFRRPEVVRVVSRGQSRRTRNFLIGAAAGVAVSLITDQTFGAYLRNESNPESARPLIWTLPIAVGGAVGAAIPSYPVIYRK